MWLLMFCVELWLVINALGGSRGDINDLGGARGGY